MEKVKPTYDFMTPPAARQEDITQPMGPLEEGDQALVDAVAAFPQGRHEVQHEGGNTFMVKEGTIGQEVVAVTEMGSDGSTERTSALIEKRLGGHISADVSGQAAQQIDPGMNDVRASGNDAGRDVFNTTPDRQKAQEIKKVAAQEIEAASEAIRQQA